MPKKKKYFAVVTDSAGETTEYPLKDWVRQNFKDFPLSDTTHQYVNKLIALNWQRIEFADKVLLKNKEQVQKNENILNTEIMYKSIEEKVNPATAINEAGSLLEKNITQQSENILKPVKVGNLLQQENDEPKYRFFIPSYQRGYRWDDEQVTDLLDDLYEFIDNLKNTDQKYCLQPIVVKKLEDGRYEVLDGQQRLTTIFILLTHLKKNNNEIDLFSLEYETRPNSAEFLKNIDETVNDSNPDYYYISKAYRTINDWLKETKNKKQNIAGKLYDAIVESIEFIWYEITGNQDPIDIFTRINIGKIPLTNAELVKAVFLSKNNLSLGYASAEVNDEDFAKILTLKQNAIALEWDTIEKTLQDPKVWGFVYNGSKDFETRIDYLLDLSSHKPAFESNAYYSFKYFYDRVKNIRNNRELLDKYAKENRSFIEEEWDNLKDIFDILMEWFHDKTYNHLIGFLINQNARISDIIDEFKENNRDQFLAIIKTRIKKHLNIKNLKELSYEKNPAAVNNLLLFHNIYNSLITQDNYSTFPFDKLKEKSWTLEHIFAQNSDDLKEDDRGIWLKDHLEFFKSKLNDPEATKLVALIEKMLINPKKIDKDEFEEIFGKINNYIQNELLVVDKGLLDNEPNTVEEEYDWITDDHSIANLALLDASSNSAIKNSLFDIKRRMILQRDKDGLFIPGETKKVFLKYYTPTPQHLAYWTILDRKAYVGSIEATLIFLN